MAYLISTTDSDGVPVLLGETEWQMHILVRHPEVADFLDDIVQVVQHPNVRHQDSEDERVILYYGHIANARRLHSKLAYLLVVVKYVQAPELAFQKTGFVSSVYFLKDIKKRGESI